MCRILRPADDEAALHSLDKGSDFVSRRGAEAQAPPWGIENVPDFSSCDSGTAHVMPVKAMDFASCR